MPTLIAKPTIIEAAGTPPKKIEEFIGRVNSQTEATSIARMTSPSGWSEPGQTPEFDEYTIVLRGHLRGRAGRMGRPDGRGIAEVACGDHGGCCGRCAPAGPGLDAA